MCVDTFGPNGKECCQVYHAPKGEDKAKLTGRIVNPSVGPKFIEHDRHLANSVDSEMAPGMITFDAKCF